METSPMMHAVSAINALFEIEGFLIPEPIDHIDTCSISH